MSRFWSDHVANLAPYIPGEQPRADDLLKLNTNEHPYGPSPLALQAIKEAANDRLRLYPDPESDALREAVAGLYDVNSNQVFFGNGSDEVLAHVFNGLFRHGTRPLLMPDITYSFYPTYCRLFDIPYETLPLADDFTINVDDYVVSRDIPPAAIIIANPNAPTGIAMSLSEISRIARANVDSIIVIDEAYVDFGAESAVALLADHDNILVLQTLSKSRALAGLRVGFAVGNKQVIDGLVRVKNSFNSYPLDHLAQAGALAALNDTAYLETTRQVIVAARTILADGLARLGFDVLPSEANFVFARHPGHAGAQLAQALRDRHILVRHFKLPRISEFLRITVGTEDQCQRLLKELSAIID